MLPVISLTFNSIALLSGCACKKRALKSIRNHVFVCARIFGGKAARRSMQNTATIELLMEQLFAQIQIFSTFRNIM